MKKMNRKTIAKIAVALVLVLGVPLVSVEHRGQSPIDLTPVFKLGGVQLLYGASGSWEAVRYIAKSAKTINDSIESLMSTLAPVLRFIGSDQETFTDTTIINGQTYTWTLLVNQTTLTADNTVTTPATKNYNHGLILCKGTTTVYEIYFDDPVNPGSGDGTLMTYIPYEIFGGGIVYDATTPPTIEFILTGDKGSRVEYVSWNQGPIFVNGYVDSARVKIEEIDSGNVINFSAVAQFLDNRQFCSPGTDDWYILTFIINNSSPYNSTARFAYGSGSIPTTDTICGGPNNTTYGLFNADATNGFVDDDVAKADIPAGYPSGDDVDALFTATLAESNMQQGDITGISVSTDYTCP